MCCVFVMVRDAAAAPGSGGSASASASASGAPRQRIGGGDEELRSGLRETRQMMQTELQRMHQVIEALSEQASRRPTDTLAVGVMCYVCHRSWCDDHRQDR